MPQNSPKDHVYHFFNKMCFTENHRIDHQHYKYYNNKTYHNS